VISLLRVQRYCNEINRIIDKTQMYGKDINLVGKYLRQNINSNIRNYLDMLYDRRELSYEELRIIAAEFHDYVDDSLIRDYFSEE
jgi:conjugal transfer/entry exclusion protein